MWNSIMSQWYFFTTLFLQVEKLPTLSSRYSGSIAKLQEQQIFKCQIENGKVLQGFENLLISVIVSVSVPGVIY